MLYSINMKNDIKKHIKPLRLISLPEDMRNELKAARINRGWSQQKLGQLLGLPQMHISNIETGKLVPRFNTLLDLVRVLDYDLLMIPRSLVPAIQSIVRDSNHPAEERSVYAGDEDQDEEELPHNEV